MRRAPALVAAYAAVTLAAVLLAPGGWLRGALALPWLLFLPGWAFERWLARGATPAERAAVAAAVSVVLAAALTLTLTLAGAGPLLAPLLLAALAAWTIAFAAVSSPAARTPAPSLPRPVAAGVVAAALLAGGAFAWGFWQAPEREGFTEMWVVRADGRAEFPDSVALNGTLALRVGLRNHEGSATTYALRATDEAGTYQGGKLVVASTAALREWTTSLADGASAEEPVAWSANSTGVHRLTFEASAPGVSLRSLHVWVEVEPPAP